jgi:hypothetical protein
MALVKTRGLKHQGVTLALSNNHEDYAYDLRLSHQSQGPIEEKSGRRFESQSTYMCRVQSYICVFQNIDPPPPSPLSECVLPPHQTRRAVSGVGGQYFGRRQT